MKKGLGLLIPWLLVAPAAHAGPWAMGKGRVYLKASYQYLNSTTLAQPDGTRFTIPTFLQKNADLFVGYGLTDTFTIYTDLPFLRSFDLEDFEKVTGFGDLRFEVQAQLGAKGAWVFAVRGLAQAPTGDENAGEGILPTGSGVWEGAGVLGAGRSFARGRGYGFVELGYQYRGGGLRDGLLYNCQLGWNVGTHLVLTANFRGVEPFSKAPRDTPIGSPVGVSDRVTYALYGPTAIVKLNRAWSLQLDVEGAFNERNIATGTMLRGGVVFAR